MPKSMKNVLFVINHNSTDCCLKLLKISDLSALSIKKVVFFSNGDNIDDRSRIELQNIAADRYIELQFIESINGGYGHAINSSIKIMQSWRVHYDYIFFSNADLVFSKSDGMFNYKNGDIVGFPLYQNGTFVVGSVSALTPIIPFILRKFFGFARPEFGPCRGIHGGLFGMRCDFALKHKLFFPEKYFLYWEEMLFCYNNSSIGRMSFLSDSVIVHHEGEKSIRSDDARYYMFRNGLHFYESDFRSKILVLIWLGLNFVFATLLLFKSRSLHSVRWFFDGLRDFRKGRYGRRSVT